MPVCSANEHFTSSDITSEKVEQLADSTPNANSLELTKWLI